MLLNCIYMLGIMLERDKDWFGVMTLGHLGKQSWTSFLSADLITNSAPILFLLVFCFYVLKLHSCFCSITIYCGLLQPQIHLFFLIKILLSPSSSHLSHLWRSSHLHLFGDCGFFDLFPILTPLFENINSFLVTSAFT